MLVIQLLVLIPIRCIISLSALQGAPTLQAVRELGADLTNSDQILRTMNDARLKPKADEIYHRDGYLYHQIDQVFFGLLAFLTGVQIYRRESAAYAFMRVFMAGSLVTGTTVLLFSRVAHKPSQVVLFGVFCVWVAVWWLYFERSNRVKEVLT